MSLGLATGLLTSLMLWWGIAISANRSAARVGSPPHPIAYFDKGDSGYTTLKDQYCIDNSHRQECCSDYHCDNIVKRSTLYSECCNNLHLQNVSENIRQRSKILPLLITSAPRSGTRFIQQLFTMVGLNGLTTDNRSPQQRGIVSWKHVFDDDTYVVGTRNPTTLYKSKFRVIWHLVRDPLKALTSLAFTEPLLEDSDTSKKYIDYVSRHIELSNQTALRKLYDISDSEWSDRSKITNGVRNEKIQKFLIHRGMEIYLHWHGFINYLDVPIFRLEDLSEKNNATVLDEVCQSVGLKPPLHSEVVSFLKAQENENHQHRNRFLQATDGGDSGTQHSQKQRGQNVAFLSKQMHKDERKHRSDLDWKEICLVSKSKAIEMLRMSHSFGYYSDLKEATLCAH